MRGASQAIGGASLSPTSDLTAAADWRDDLPPAGFELAWEYLLPEHRITRRLDTLEVFSARHGMRLMELDVTVPARAVAAASSRPCFVPVAFFAKEPVAHDLELRDSSGEAISPPTKGQCMALTAEALDLLASASVLGDPPGTYIFSSSLRLLIGDVIHMAPSDARICRQEIAKEVDPGRPAWLVPLLEILEDHHLLWAPIRASIADEQRLSLRRSEDRQLKPVFPQIRGRSRGYEVTTSDDDVFIGSWNPVLRWVRGFDPSAAVGRLLVTFGLMPVKFEQEGFEAPRFASYHLCMVPPAGLLLREVKAGEVSKSPWLPHDPVIKELEDGEGQTIQGEDTHTAHIHLARPENPPRLYSRITIGMRPGITTLWALVAVLTCLLLWAFHRNIHEFPTEHAGQSCAHLKFLASHSICAPGSSLLAGAHPHGIASAAIAHGTPSVSAAHVVESPPHHHHHSRISLAVAVAVLLVGPTFASVWTLRDHDRALVRSMLSGVRMLLLGSAILSVATALALAGITPFGWGRGQAVGWYASFSYTIAIVVAIGWLQARSVIWLIYRKVLTTTTRNLLATVVLCLIAAEAISRLENFPPYSRVLLLLTGFGFTAIAGNRASAALGEVSRVPALLAGIGGILTLAVLGREFEFYNHPISQDNAHQLANRGELTLAAIALFVLFFRLLLDAYAALKVEMQEKGAKAAAANSQS